MQNVGVEGNEMADALAWQGANTYSMGPKYFCEVGDGYLSEQMTREKDLKSFQKT